MISKHTFMLHSGCTTLMISPAALKLQSGQLNMPQLGCYVFINLNKNPGIKYKILISNYAAILKLQ